MLRLALGEQARFPELARTLFEHGPRRTYARLREFLAAKVAAGQIDVPDLQIAAEQFLGGIIGHQQLRLALGLRPPPQTGDRRARRSRRPHVQRGVPGARTDEPMSRRADEFGARRSSESAWNQSG